MHRRRGRHRHATTGGGDAADISTAVQIEKNNLSASPELADGSQ